MPAQTSRVDGGRVPFRPLDGEVAEWSKALDWNSSYILTGVRGFESHPLRQYIETPREGRFCLWPEGGMRTHAYSGFDKSALPICTSPIALAIEDAPTG